jgi:hypothetical protein
LKDKYPDLKLLTLKDYTELGKTLEGQEHLKLLITELKTRRNSINLRDKKTWPKPPREPYQANIRGNYKTNGKKE